MLKNTLRGLRLSLGAFRTSPVESLHVEASDTSHENRRITIGMQYATTLKAYPSKPAYDCVVMLTINNTIKFNLLVSE